MIPRIESRRHRVKALKEATLLLDEHECETLNRAQLQKVMQKMGGGHDPREKDLDFVWTLASLRSSSDDGPEFDNPTKLLRGRSSGVKFVAEAISIWRATLAMASRIEIDFSKFRAELPSSSLGRGDVRDFMRRTCERNGEWPPTETEIDGVLETATRVCGLKLYRGVGDGTLSDDDLLFALKEWYCSDDEEVLSNQSRRQVSCACVVS